MNLKLQYKKKFILYVSLELIIHTYSNQNVFYLYHDHDPDFLVDDDDGLQLIHWGALTSRGHLGPGYISIHYLYNLSIVHRGMAPSLSEKNSLP